MNYNQDYSVRVLTNQRGGSLLGNLVVLVVIFALGYIGYKVGTIYYSYFELHNQMSALITVADTLPDNKIRQRLAKQIEALNIPADIDELRLERRAQTMLISLPYSEILTVGFGDYEYELWTFDLLCQVDGPIPQG